MYKKGERYTISSSDHLHHLCSDNFNPNEYKLGSDNYLSNYKSEYEYSRKMNNKVLSYKHTSLLNLITVVVTGDSIQCDNGKILVPVVLSNRYTRKSITSFDHISYRQPLNAFLMGKTNMIQYVSSEDLKPRLNIDEYIFEYDNKVSVAMSTVDADSKTIGSHRCLSYCLKEHKRIEDVIQYNDVIKSNKSRYTRATLNLYSGDDYVSIDALYDGNHVIPITENDNISANLANKTILNHIFEFQDDLLNLYYKVNIYNEIYDHVTYMHLMDTIYFGQKELSNLALSALAVKIEKEHGNSAYGFTFRSFNLEPYANQRFLVCVGTIHGDVVNVEYQYCDDHLTTSSLMLLSENKQSSMIVIDLDHIRNRRN